MELFEDAVLDEDGEKLLSWDLLALRVFTSGELRDSSPGGLDLLSRTSSDWSLGSMEDC